MDMTRFRPERTNAALVVIDFQERLAAAMDPVRFEAVIANAERLLIGFDILDCPAHFTEQYPQGLGPTVDRLIPHAQEAAPAAKLSFSCCGDLPLAAWLRDRGRTHAVLCGMETHVCVLQTALDLLQAGFSVHVVRDATLSRRPESHEAGLALLAAAGAVVTTAEIVLFQLQARAGDATFKAISKLVR
jgi:nicotinamidase-related amidase